MSFLSVGQVGFAHGGGEPLFEQVQFQLGRGWTGLVGANGTGKTTLLEILAGVRTPDTGHVRWPRGTRVSLCPQRVDARTAHIEAFAAADDAPRWRALLRLQPEALGRWATLSPGERKRWQVGAALWAMPDALLLDEPTNHLDDDARVWLESALREFTGVGLLVSHDRTLLDALTQQTLRLHRSRVQLFPGAYTAARAQWEAARAALEQTHAALSREVKHAEARRRDASEARQAAEQSISSRRRMKSPRDRDARSMGRTVVAQWAEARLGRGVAAANRAVERLQDARRSLALDGDAPGRSIFVSYVPAPRPVLGRLELDGLWAGGRQLLGAVRRSFGRHDRIHLRGPNGAGKSTLLRALWEQLNLPPEAALLLPQELEAGEDPRQAIASLDPERQARVWSLLAALGCDPARVRRSAHPSPGETRKLALALGLGRHAWFLALDEPTNHLDVPSIERLEAALHAYPGALVLVTHDTALAQHCTHTRWDISSGELVVR